MNKTAERGIFLLLFSQLGLTGIAALLGWLLEGRAAFYSAWLAGFCCIVPNAVFSFIAFSKAGARAAFKIVRSFYRAEALKWMLTAWMMAMIFAFVPISGASFFITFAVVQSVFWVAPAFFGKAGF